MLSRLLSSVMTGPVRPLKAPVIDGTNHMDRASVSSTLCSFTAQMQTVPGGADRIPFSVMMEVKGDAPTLNRQLRDTGWTASALAGNNHNAGGDCSHKSDGGGKSYVRLQSPCTSVADGAFDTLARAVATLHDSGVAVGPTAAMRVRVPDKDFDGTFMLPFMKQVLSNEDILYQLGRNGTAGRKASHKNVYAARPSGWVKMPDTAKVDPKATSLWRAALNKRNGGINSFNTGWWEARFYDACLNPGPVAANIALLLCTMGSAVSGRAQAGTTHAFKGTPWLPRARFDQFMATTVGEGPIADQLRQQFEASGGRLSGKSAANKAVASTPGGASLDVGALRLWPGLRAEH